MLLDLGLDPNSANQEGRTPLMGAALKGRPEVIQLLVDRGARLDARDRGSRDTHIPGATIAGLTWQALDYAEGLVRVGVQSAVERPEAKELIRKRSEEHTSELQSQSNLVCRLLLEKKKTYWPCSTCSNSPHRMHAAIAPGPCLP